MTETNGQPTFPRDFSSGIGSRHTRIHFPTSETTNTRIGQKRTASSSQGRNSPLSAAVHANSRRRVLSDNHSRRSLEPPHSLAHRLGFADQPAVGSSSGADHGPSRNGDDLSLGLFSDEYELAQEDTEVLQDVQRALKLKSRRQNRITSTGKSSTSIVKRDSPMKSHSLPSTVSPSKQAIQPFPRRPSYNTQDSHDIDFSPSTAPHDVHPVPSRGDDGVLDWSVPQNEERGDRRWTISLTKRKGKERDVMTAAAAERQAADHTYSLDRTRTTASPNTMRKVAITSDQLSRRYELIYTSLAPETEPFDLTKVSRWYSEQNNVVRSSLEKSEPFTWLKHLSKRGSAKRTRSPWHLTALIMEEYLRARLQTGQLRDNRSMPDAWYTQVPPQLPKQSLESPTSFDPLLNPSRPSIDLYSRRSEDSAYSSGYSGYSPQNRLDSTSPAASQHHVVLHVGPADRIKNESEDQFSLRRSFQPEDPRTSKPRYEDYSSRQSVDRISDRHATRPSMDKASNDPSTVQDSNAVESLAVKIEPASSVDLSLPEHPKQDRIVRVVDSATPNRSSERRLTRTSLPNGDRLSTILEQTYQNEMEEAKLNAEYERKAQLLHEATQQNSRTRQLLNRISGGVREYESMQSNFCKLLGVPYHGLPQDLLEAFSHDPSAVTGRTRRFNGYQAVDDIHHRVVRQRAIIQGFINSHPETSSSIPTEGHVKKPIDNLLLSLNKIHDIRQELAVKATEVSDVLAKVQKTQAAVKSEYNDALSHVSVVYPELATIAGLDESYKDQYQHFWELGMDALTFILDTITPVWRTYGRTIGVDIRDFLIVPLYRNEFTGEPKRYRIKRIPKRSLRHWLGLTLFFYATVAVTLFQFRTAVASSRNYRLLWIPYEGIRWSIIPLFWVGIFFQWVIVLAELVIVLFQLGTLAWWIGWFIGVAD